LRASIGNTPALEGGELDEWPMMSDTAAWYTQRPVTYLLMHRPAY